MSWSVVDKIFVAGPPWVLEILTKIVMVCSKICSLLYCCIPQIITFSKVMLMYFYAMKVIKFGATCISYHLFKKTTLCFICIFIAAILKFVSKMD